MARIVPMEQSHIRSQWACQACLKGYHSVDEARNCSCRVVAEEMAAKKRRAVEAGEISGEEHGGNA